MSFKILFILSALVKMFAFLLSFSAVDEKRKKIKHDNFIYVNFSKLTELSQNRWIGISGMINVLYTKDKNLKIFKKALKDTNSDFNFYEKNFFYSQDKKDENYISEENYILEHSTRYLKNVFTPGFMAFFYFSGSIVLLAILNFSLVFLMIFSEKFCNYFMSSYKLFTSLFSLILVWRIIHLGLYPINSLIFYLILLFTPIIILLIDYKSKVILNLK